jgi:hypothetical protein
MSRLHGTWQAEGPARSVPGPAIVAVALVLMAGSGAAAAIEAAATVILAVALAVAALAVAGLIAAVVFLRRWNQREAEKFMIRAEALCEPQPVRQVAAPQPTMVVNHFHGGTHLHIGAGGGSHAEPVAVEQIHHAVTDLASGILESAHRFRLPKPGARCRERMMPRCFPRLRGIGAHSANWRT